jgi:CRP-like cAMP-binding protein
LKSEIESLGTRGNKVLSSIQPAAKEFFAEHGEVREMRFGEVLFEHGAPMTHMVFPHEGVVSIVAEMENGKTVEKASIGLEGFLGFVMIMGGGTALGRSIVQVPGSATWVTVADVDTALERFVCVREIMLRYAKSLIVQLLESVACNSLHTAEQRVSRWLLHAHDRMGGDKFHLKQESLAQALGLRRATVSSACSDLMEAGAISYLRGKLTVTNRSVLHERSCACYDRVKNAELA